MADDPTKKCPYAVLMERFGLTSKQSEFEQHLLGCFEGARINPGYGPSVFFALEMIWGIAIHWKQLEQAGVPKPLAGADGTLRSDFKCEVPWFAIAALAAAWETYKNHGPPLGKAFGLEAEGPGKRPLINALQTRQDHRAIARFITLIREEAASDGNEMTVQGAKGEAANTFGLSDDMIDLIWKEFGKDERDLSSI